MNGYKMIAEAYRKAFESGKIQKEEAEKMVRIYEFLGSCNQDDFCTMFDSSAFNEIAKSYMRLAVKELIDEETIDEDQGRAIRNRFSLLFDEKTAKEII